MQAAGLTEAIKTFVRETCQQPENAFGAAFFEQHILVVRDYGLKLAEVLSADPEVVTLAAYLHDLAAVQDFQAVSGIVQPPFRKSVRREANGRD
jgi:HD superfamily phosphodiesterase